MTSLGWRVAILSAPLLCGSLPASAAPVQGVKGPVRICFKYSSFQLLEGERVTEFEGGLEGMRVTVTTLRDSYDIGESEIFAPRGLHGPSVFEGDGLKVYRQIREESVRYGIRGVTSFSGGKPVLLIWLSGPALTGKALDRRVYSRFTISDPASAACGARFTYGWF